MTEGTSEGKGVVVRVSDAQLVAEGGPAWFVVSHLPDARAVADKAASAGGTVSVDEVGRLRAMVTPQQLINAIGRTDALLGRELDPVVTAVVDAWCRPVQQLPDGLGADNGPTVMGIVNVTPDSFSDGGVAYDPGRHPATAIDHGRSLLEAGADILDVGGESTRPGADPVSVDDELERVIPVIEALAADGVVSIDTTKAAVARAAVAAGARMVNDTSAGRGDDDMLATVGELAVPYVVMHMQGSPATMQDAPAYDDVVAEVYEFLAGSVGRAVDAGIDRQRIIIDPGLGFGKTLDHNLALLRATRQLCGLGHPVLVGPSRKSMIGQLTGVADASRRGPGSVAAAALAVASGAACVRVHDVEATVQAAAVAASLLR